MIVTIDIIVGAVVLLGFMLMHWLTCETLRGVRYDTRNGDSSSTEEVAKREEDSARTAEQGTNSS